MTTLEIHYDPGGRGVGAALYVDGKLDQGGDAYHAEEKALDLAGVKPVHDSAFMRGQTLAGGVAPTLTHVEAYRRVRDSRAATAEALRRQAAELTEQADRLERGQ